MNRQIIRVGRSFGCAEIVRLRDGTNPNGRNRPQLKLRVPELPTHPEKRVLPTLQGEVADKGPTATITAQVRSIHSLCSADVPSPLHKFAPDIRQ